MRPGNEKVENDLVISDPDPAATTMTPAGGPGFGIAAFGRSAKDTLDRAKEIADLLADVIRRRNLAVEMRGRKHVLVEGWTLAGSLLGVFPVVRWTRAIRDGDGEVQGYEARAEARTLDGRVVGAAEAQCTRDENLWGWNPIGRNGRPLEPRPDFALRSMAQTRAIAKALRLPLGFVVSLAGYESTPAEEMIDVEGEAVDDAVADSEPSIRRERRSASETGDVAALFSAANRLAEARGWSERGDAAVRRALRTDAGTIVRRGRTERAIKSLTEAAKKPAPRAKSKGYPSGSQVKRLFAIARSTLGDATREEIDEQVRRVVRSVTGQDHPDAIPTRKAYEEVAERLRSFGRYDREENGDSDESTEYFDI